MLDNEILFVLEYAELLSEKNRLTFLELLRAFSELPPEPE